MSSHVDPGTEEHMSFNEANQSEVNYSSREEEDLDIPWSELILKENIGTGTLFETLCKIY